MLDIPPMVLYTSLKDTLSQKTFNALEIDNVIGVKVRHVSGLDVRYFEYYANSQKLSRAMAASSFVIQDGEIDTSFRKINPEEFYQLHRSELGEIASRDAKMFNRIEAQDELFECIKPPLTHHIIINKTSGKVIHRIMRTA